MSNYWGNKLKELEEEEKKKKQKENEKSNGSSNYWSNKMDELKNGTSSLSTDDIAPIKENVHGGGGRTFGETEEKQNKNKWFQKGAFADGYDLGDVTKTILGTIVDTTATLAQGVGNLAEGVGDAGVYLVAGGADLLGADSLAKSLREDAKVELVNDFFDDAAKKNGMREVSVLGDKSRGVGQALGQIGGIIATGGLGASAGLSAAGVTALTTSAVGTSSMGHGITEGYNSEQYLKGEATDADIYAYGVMKGAIDAGSEMLFGGLGKTVNALGVSRGIGALDDIFASKLTSKISNQIARNAAEGVIKATGEGLEEVIAAHTSAVAKKLTYASDEELNQLVKDENALEQFVTAAIASGIAQGGDFVKANKSGTDLISGLTQNEQKVIDKEIENRIAEEEADGKKLTNKEKTAIEEAVKNDLEKGYISIDTIESALGGDTYKSYQDTIANEDALKKELDELRQMKTGEMNDIQTERLAELKAMNLSDTTKRDSLKTKLYDEVFGLAKDSKLVESYNERARSGEKFTADLKGYNDKQKAIVQKAIDSGILNNTNRSHEFVDMVARIGAEKNLSFDFADNAKLKESGFAVDGATINGFVNKDGVTVNINSKKALNTVVGHEITHVLEGTEFYTELQKAVTEYAKAKGDYQGRYDSLAKLYKSVEDADIDAELTADLVGDYLFTDSDFINNLSTKHRNVFQKIYDEVKYLCKVATAGSKEARQLEKVKKAFEDAYRADSKGVGGTKYSATADSDGKQLTKEQSEYFKDSKMRDDNGNLKVMYHGSQDAGFHIFDPSMSDDDTSLFFVDRNDVAASYSGTAETYEAKTIRTAEDMNNFLAEIGYDNYEAVEKSGKFELLENNEHVAYSDTAQGLYEEFCWYEGVGEGDANYKVYLNLTNPLEIDAEGRKWSDLHSWQRAAHVKRENAEVRRVDGDFRLFDKNTGEEFPDATIAANSYTENMGRDVLRSIMVDKANSILDITTENLRSTRDVSKWAKAHGYDGVIFKNIHDNGGYSNGSEGASTVAVAFSSEQIKSVANAKPTSNPDIRYSLTEYTPEEKQAHNKAVLEHFGRTVKWAETGYLLLDGSKLDLSGKHNGAPGGYRTVDHRDITEALGYDYGGDSYSGSLIQFMGEGNIRIVPEINGINLSVKPTEAQEQALSDYISRNRGEMLLDIDDLNGNTVVSVEYPKGTYYKKILEDIREWFDNGKKPEVSGLSAFRSLTKEGESPRTYGNYNIFGEDIAFKPEQTAAPVEDVAPVREDVTTEESSAVGYKTEPTVSEMEQVAPIKAETPTENIAPLTTKKRKPSKAALARFTKKQTYSGGANLQGAYNADGKQYMSDGIFAVEFNTVDESIPHNKDFPIEKMQSLLGDAVENQSAEKYGIDLEKIIEINKANKGNKDSKALVDVGGSLYDGKYIEALMRAVPNPTFALSKTYGGAKMLVAVGENGTAILMPVRAGNKLTAAYEAQEINIAPETFAPATAEDAMAAREASAPSLDNASIPNEVEAPYYEESTATNSDDPFTERDYKEVGNRKVKAYMSENPEVKPYFQEAAQAMLGDLQNSTRGERWYNDEVYYESGGEKGFSGTKRHTTDDIAYLLDKGYSYAEIEKGLNAIIQDHGAENIAIAKRIEFALNDRLRNGYTDVYGDQIPPNDEYLKLFSKKQAAEAVYNEAPMPSDADAPYEDIAPVKESAPVAPVAEKYEAIRPERPKRTLQEAPEPQPRMVRADKSDKGEMRSWAETSTESEALNGEIDIEELDQDLIHYQPISNRKTLEKANAKLGQLGYEKSVTYFEGRFAGSETKLEDIVLGERLVQEAVKRGDKATAMKLIQDISILGTELGQKVQALSIIQRLTPEGQLAMLNRIVERGKAKGDKTFEGVEVTQEQANKILETRKADGTFDRAELDAAVEGVKQEIADQMSVSFGEKINAWRYLAMLGNPKTHVRNLISNVAMKATAAVKNAVARTIEDIAPIKTRTKTWRSATEDVKAYAKQVTAEMQAVLSGESKYSASGDIKAKRRIFKNKALNAMYELNSKLLTKEDTIFKNPAFESSFREYLTANGIRTKADIQNNPEIVEKGKQYATEQALIATFQQESWLANKIGEIENKNAAFGVAVGAVMPFKKTPINIAKTGLMYSPLGFAKSAYDVVQVKKGNMDASTLVDHLAQNVTGTALTIAGYLLAQSGILTGAGDDDKEGKYDYQLGEQGYSLKIGDQTYSLSWLTPVSMPLFVGANAYEQLVEDKGWSGDVVMETLAQTLDPLSEMSFLSGLDNVLSSYDSGIQKFMGIGTSMLQNYATQFIPTLSSQVAAITDDTKRTTKVGADSDFRIVDETVNQIKYKIPGLRQTLEPATDIWGNEVKQSDNLLARAFESAIAPYSRKENIATEIDEEIKSLYRETGEDGLIPTVPKNYLNYDNVKYEMSAKEHTAYKQTYGQTANKMLEALFNTSTYRNATAEERADMVDAVYDYARDEASRKYFAGKGVTYTNATEEGKEYYRDNFIKGAIENDVAVEEYGFSYKNPEKYAFLKEIGVSYDEYAASEDSKDAYSWAFNNPEKYELSRAVANDVITFRKYASELYEIKADKDENGKSINGSRKEKVIDYINNLDADYGEKIILFKMEYNADDTYNYDIIEYLNGRDDISREEMESILKELGFIVHSDGRVTW